MKKIISLGLTLMMLICLPIQVIAAEPSESTAELLMPRATRQYSFNVSAGRIAKTTAGISLSAGETVRINATYTPSSASADFGLIDSEGNFYYINVKSGSIDETVEVDENGTYYFAVRNNSSSKISVTGQINY